MEEKMHILQAISCFIPKTIPDDSMISRGSFHD